MWNVLTVPTVWLSVTVKIPHCRNSKNIQHCRGQLKYHTVGTVRKLWNILTVPTVWYFNCPRPCGMFLRFRQCGILTVPDNVE
jgi:hypothetical protein